jgi:hypothetical protein
METLWVCYWYGGVSFIKNGTVTDYGKPEGLPPDAVLAFARDRHDAMLGFTLPAVVA